MASLKDIRFKATFDSKGVITGLTQIDKKGKAVSKNIQTGFKNSAKATGVFSKELKNLFAGAGVIFAFKKALDFATEAKNAARDAFEIRSKFDQVFISLSAGANRVADEFAKAFGLAGTTARELLASTGDLLVGFGFTEEAAFDMSKQVNELAQDLASFQNFSGGAAGASFALTKALIGETESAKALSIAIKQNTPEFRDNVKEIMRARGITELQAKAVEILRIAYEQSNKAIGDYARTQNSLANIERKLAERQKETSEQLGKALIPLYIKIDEVLIDFVSHSTSALKNFEQNNFWDILSTAALRFFLISKGQSVETTKLLEEFSALNRQGLTPLMNAYNQLIPLVSTYNQKVSEADLQFDIQVASIREMRKELKNVNDDIEKQGKTSTILQSLIGKRGELEKTIKELLGGQTAELRKQKKLLDGFSEVTGGGDKPRKVIFFDTKDRPGLKNVALLDEVFEKSKEGFAELSEVGSAFVDVFQSEFSQMWESVFGEANSLLEKLGQKLASGFLTDALSFGLSFIPGGSLFSGFLGLFSSAANTGGGDKGVFRPQTRPLVLQIDGSRVAETVLEPFLENEMNRVLRINRF